MGLQGSVQKALTSALGSISMNNYLFLCLLNYQQHSACSCVSDVIINPLIPLSLLGETQTMGQLIFLEVSLLRLIHLYPQQRGMGLGHIWVPILDVRSWANCLTSLSFHSVSFGVEYYSLLDLLCMAVARFKSKGGYEDTLKAESTTRRAGLGRHFPSALWAGGG